jgi:hypothetical protein
MAQNIGGGTKFILSPREIFYIGSALLSLAGIYYQLKSEVEGAKLLPAPAVTKEYIDLQHQAVISEVSLAKEDICVVRDDVSEMKDVIKTLDQRIYEIYTSTMRAQAYQDDLITYHQWQSPK